MLYLSPQYEFGDMKIEEYSDILIQMFFNIVSVSNSLMEAKFVNFHLRSPADRPFFAALTSGLGSAELFKDVAMKGAWLYITKK